MEYFDDSLANPIKINVEWQIRRLGNVRPPASSEHQKRHGGNNISSENVIIKGDIKPRIIWVELLVLRLFCKFTALWSWMLPSFSSSISGPWSPPSFHHSSILPRSILALYDVYVMMGSRLCRYKQGYPSLRGHALGAHHYAYIIGDAPNPKIRLTRKPRM